STTTLPMLQLARVDQVVEARVDAETMRAEGLRSRPAPDLLLAACRELGVAPVPARSAPTRIIRCMDAIETRSLTKRYGRTLALDGLDLRVTRGEVYGYLGPNGAGKTTTIRLLLGLHRPTGGSAALFGVDAWREPVAAHRHVAYVAGEPTLWPGLTSAETFAYLARLHGSTDSAYRDELIQRFRVEPDKKVRALSKG